MEICYWEVYNIYDVIQNHLKIGCDELMMHTINLKATTKIAKQRTINHMPLKDRKMGVKIQIIKKKARKEESKSKGYGENTEQIAWWCT